jgi:hypothetical protein
MRCAANTLGPCREQSSNHERDQRNWYLANLQSLGRGCHSTSRLDQADGIVDRGAMKLPRE